MGHRGSLSHQLLECTFLSLSAAYTRLHSVLGRLAYFHSNFEGRPNITMTYCFPDASDGLLYSVLFCIRRLWLQTSSIFPGAVLSQIFYRGGLSPSLLSLPLCLCHFLPSPSPSSSSLPLEVDSLNTARESEGAATRPVVSGAEP